MNTLSVAIVACDEALTIGRTLESIAWVDEIILVDSGSRDDTVAIALQYGAKVYQEKWKGYGAQVNSALDKCTSDWILNIDADEVVSVDLCKEIQDLLSGEPEYSAYLIPRRNQIFGRWMKHGGLYPDRNFVFFGEQPQD